MKAQNQGSTDGIVWQCINNRGFCSFKVKLPKHDLCRNRYNLTGICCKTGCPLANSQYATVVEEPDGVYLKMKVIERQHLPAELWESIKLDENFEEAIKQLHKYLEYWPSYLLSNCKKRLTRITEVHMRMRKLEKAIEPRLATLSKKVTRREKIRQSKALSAAQIEKSIKKELLSQLAEGKYNGIYNYARTAFEDVCQLISGEKEQDLADKAKQGIASYALKEEEEEEEFEYEDAEHEAPLKETVTN